MSIKLIIFASLIVGCLSAAQPEPYKPKYESKGYEEVPHCAKKTTKSYCVEDTEYPMKEVQYALDQHYQAVLAFYKDIAVNTANSVDTLHKLIEETYLCPSTIDYIQPMRAINAEGKWRIIVNHVESYGYKFDQHVRVEQCDAVGKECPLVPSCYDSKCVQKNVFHRFLVFDAYDSHFPFVVENFKLPASCGCVVGAFHPPPQSTYKGH